MLTVHADGLASPGDGTSAATVMSNLGSVYVQRTYLEC